jgi:hypothetical protein
MFRIIANSTISFGLGYMCAIYGKPEPPDWKQEIKNDINKYFNDKEKNKQEEIETEKLLYNKHRVIYDEKGRAIYYGAP